MDNEKKIEIPFGAFDSELIHQEINIPNGFKAVIKGNKIILTRAESEDEEIKKAMINFFKSEREEGDVVLHYGVNIESMIAWLEKQDPKKHEEELEKAYKTADKVQYRRGYEDATKEMEKQGEQKVNYTTLVETGNGGINALVTRELPTDGCDEQKPAWSEEDENILSNAIFFIREYQTPTRDKTMLNAAKEAEDWLKSLKQRIGG